MTHSPVRDQGSREVVRANVAEDFDQVQPFVGRFVESATFEAVRASTLPTLGEAHARKEKRT